MPGSANFLNVIESTRLLGIQLTTDLRWSQQTSFLCRKAVLKFWILRRMKTKGFENIQKSLTIILGDIYSSYEEACTLLTAEPLSDRRQTQCVNFVKRAVKSGLHSDIFIPASSSILFPSGLYVFVAQ